MKHFFTGRVRTVMILAVVLSVVLIVVSGLTKVNIPGMIVQGILTPSVPAPAP